MSSQISTTTTHLLLRRNTSGAPDDDTDTTSDTRPLLPPTNTPLLPPSTPLLPPSAVRQRSDSIPRLLEQQQNNSHNSTNVHPLSNAAPHIQDTQSYVPPKEASHKRKQSDIPGDLPISPAAFRSSLNLESIEQGWNDECDDDDSIVYSGPTSYSEGFVADYISGGARNKLKVKWVAVAVMTLLALYTLTGRRSNGNLPSAEDADGYESVGEPFEAHIKYNSIEYISDLSRIGRLISSGPDSMTTDGNAGGMYTYKNVCVTNNVDYPKAPLENTSMRGLIRFTDKKEILNNKKRCVPCTAEEIDKHENDGKSTSSVGHSCGMKGLHEMYASSVPDWNNCIQNKDNHALMIRTKQTQSPSHVTNVHFFDRPTFLLQFTANDRESSLFDTLFSYLPHWQSFRTTEYPFDGILSHSVEGCLSHSRNWLCEILHHITAFGTAKEILWEQSPDTLYCFRSLYVNKMGYQRSLAGGQVTKPLMDEFRDELFRSIALPRPRDMSEMRKKDAKLGMTRPFKIALFANSYHSTNVWNGMENLVIQARGMTKYHGVELSVVESFEDLTVAEQARAFNLADAVIMATGEHMANAIFVTDDTAFVELGCESFSSIENKHFMGFVLGTHWSVQGCVDGDNGNEEICVKCVQDGMGSTFSITEDAFFGIVDELVKSHQEKIAFMRDSRRRELED